MTKVSNGAIRVAVVGGRDFNDYDRMCRVLDSTPRDIIEIVSGGAKGADTLAKRYALEHNIQYTEHLPDWKTHGKSAGYKRNVLIVNDADIVVAFWDGCSRGTKHTIDIAKAKNKELYVRKYD